jgi:transcriptional regulator with GAF, ATPase, and Fis domain
MTDDRAVRIGLAFARHSGGAGSQRLCDASADVLQVSGAGITIMSGRNVGPVCASDAVVGQLEDLQFALGEGPGHDAFVTGTTVSEPDLGSNSPSRWSHYAQRAIELGAGAVFAVPLRLHAHPIGVLTLYNNEAGSLTADQYADSAVVAEVLALAMESTQARATPPLLADELADPNAHRAEVHQASGMLAIQLQISVDDALARMRAHAFAVGQSVAFVAQEIVAHRLRLGDDRSNRAEDE